MARATSAQALSWSAACSMPPSASAAVLGLPSSKACCTRFHAAARGPSAASSARAGRPFTTALPRTKTRPRTKNPSATRARAAAEEAGIVSPPSLCGPRSEGRWARQDNGPAAPAFQRAGTCVRSLSRTIPWTLLPTGKFPAPPELRAWPLFSSEMPSAKGLETRMAPRCLGPDQVLESTMLADGGVQRRFLGFSC